MTSKNEQHIDSVIKLLQKGVDQPEGVGETTDVVLNKLDGTIPVGADLATFSGRKRAMKYGFLLSLLTNSLQLVVALFVVAITSFLLWSDYPEIQWLTTGIGVLALIWSFFCIKGIKYNFQMYRAIKAVQQQYPDPQRKVTSQRFQNEQALSAKFARPRLISRLAGLVIFTIAGAILYYLYSFQPAYVSIYVYTAPAFLMIGLSLILYPINAAENKYYYGSTRMPFKDMPFGAKLCLIMGAVLSIVMVIFY